MEKLKHLASGIAFSAVVLFSVGTGKAALTGCGSGNAANLGNGATGGITGTGAATNTPSQGCGQTDLGFNTFTVNNQAGTADLAGPTAATVDPTTSGGAITGGNTISNIDLIFTGAFTTGAHTGAHTLEETINYLVTPNLGGAAEEPTTPAGDRWALQGVTALGIGTAAITGGPGIPTATDPTITLTETVCIGQTSAAGCAATNEATLTLTVTYSGNGTTLTTGTVNNSSCTGVAASFGCVASGGGITFNSTLSAFVMDEVFINHPADTGINSYTVSFADFTDPFVQGEIGPEPSTFLLLGSALVGLGVIRFRKRKQA